MRVHVFMFMSFGVRLINWL